MTRAFKWVLGGLAVLPALAAAEGGSLWSERSVALFADRKAMGVGDVVTVVIVESSSASNESQLQLTKKTSSTVDGKGSGALDFIPLFGGEIDTRKEHQGRGETTLSGRMTARVTAQITAVLPNGNLVIEGSRTVKINDDVDQISVRGVVRPEDVRADNTVLSTHLSEAQISYVGSGPGKHAARPGILTRILDLIF